jgi:putative flippase GtrA
MTDFLPTIKSLVWFKQVVRFTMIGLFNNSIGYLVYLFLTYIGTAPRFTMTCLYIIGTCLAYFGNRNYTFSELGNKQNSKVRFVIVYLIGYGINFFILLFFVDHLHYPHQWVQGAAIFIVAGFLIYRYEIFCISA